MLTLENETLRLEVDAQRGAKITRLTYLEKGIDLLVGKPESVPQPSPSSWPVRFTLADSYGFDEMFPTIDADTCTSLPWGPIAFPDHGDLWSLPHLGTLCDGVITTEVLGTSFPYRFMRTVQLNGPTVELGYTVTNLTPYPVEVLWAAHMLFALHRGISLELPDEVDTVINAYEGGIFGPKGQLITHQERLFDRCCSFLPDSGLCGKWYTARPLQNGWVRVVDGVHRITTTIRFDTARVPYLGVWISEGGWQDQRSIGIEPATAPMDSPSNAREYGASHLLKPHATETWRMEVTTFPLPD